MRRRALVLPIAAVVIAALTAYKLTRTYTTGESRRAIVPTIERPAPRFELLNEKKPSELVRLETHLGRKRVVVAFYDGEAGADKSPLLAELRVQHAQLQQAGILVLAVSTAIPQKNRQAIEACGTFPFPLLTDHDLSVHRAWGRLDASGKPLSGVFLVNRAGNVAWSTAADVPQPLAGAQADPATLISSLLDGR